MITLKDQCIQEEIQFTTNIFEAIYILPDGKMIDGCFMDNQRTEDHRILELISDFDRYDGDKFWLDILETKKVIMLIPETKTIVKTSIKTTEDQRFIIESLKYYGYTLQDFK